MIRFRSAGIALVVLALSLAGCGSGGGQAEQTPAALDSVQETAELSDTELDQAGEAEAQPSISFDPAVLLGLGGEGFPGPEPVPFGRGLFQGGFHSAPVLAPDGNTVWWGGSYGSEKVYTSRYVDGVWMEQEEVSFSDDIQSYRDPFISPDGLKFYFISEAPLPGQIAGGKENIWMMEWESGAWSEPQPLPESVNHYQIHWTVSVASNYDLYFNANVDGNPDIY
ncbi:MAG: PD40 domain-containing protein [Anaerolineales bacterium]|nr:PD40 domain-containing protein [Anaerolineales bacterium]